MHSDYINININIDCNIYTYAIVIIIITTLYEYFVGYEYIQIGKIICIEKLETYFDNHTIIEEQIIRYSKKPCEIKIIIPENNLNKQYYFKFNNKINEKDKLIKLKKIITNCPDLLLNFSQFIPEINYRFNNQIEIIEIYSSKTNTIANINMHNCVYLKLKCINLHIEHCSTKQLKSNSYIDDYICGYNEYRFISFILPFCKNLKFINITNFKKNHLNCSNCSNQINLNLQCYISNIKEYCKNNDIYLSHTEKN